jgi:Tol biopolymer transport system component/uncharacterized protein YraI
MLYRLKTKTLNRAPFALVVVLVSLLVTGIWLTLPALSDGRVLAQEVEATPVPEKGPARGRGDGAGRQSGGQDGSRGDSRTRPAQPTSEPSEETRAAAETEATAEESSVTSAPSLSIVAIAGVNGAGLAERPQGETLYTVPIGTAMQAAGRTEDNKWLYVVREAVVKGGVEVEPAFAGWTPKADVIAFSIENLPVFDADEVQIVLPDTSALPEDFMASEADNPEATAAITAAANDAADSVDEVMAITGFVNLDDSRLNVRSGPGTTTAIAGKLLPNATVSVLGRSEDAAWLLITDTPSGLVGWVAADFINTDVDSLDLPLIPVPSVSTPTTTSVAVPVATESNEAASEGVSLAPAAASGSTDLIVFQTSLGATFYAYDLASGTRWPLTHGFDPAISPDGRTAAFTRDGGENGIYLIDIDGGNERRIFAERGRLASPKWSPAGDWIVFSRGNTFSECYQLGRTCLTAGQIREQNPNIDLGRFELVREPRYHLAKVDVNGENYTDVAALDTARAPDWIETGIVYQSSAGLQITDASADAENRLVIDDYLKPYFHDPDWQPGQGAGGGRIAYMGKEGSHWEIFTVNPDGSSVTALTRPSTTLKGELPSNVAPSWSPDGSKIAFLSNRADGGGSDIWRLWIMDADGGNQRPLDVDLTLDYTFGDEQAVGW